MPSFLRNGENLLPLDQDAAQIGATDLAVARAAYDVNDNLRLGTLMTHGDPTGLTDNTYAGDFVIRLTQLNAAYSFTPDLSLATFVQHDSVNDELGVNARLQWIIQPSRELFVVFNHGIEPQLADLNRAPPTGNAVIVKLRWDSYW